MALGNIKRTLVWNTPFFLSTKNTLIYKETEILYLKKWYGHPIFPYWKPAINNFTPTKDSLESLEK